MYINISNLKHKLLCKYNKKTVRKNSITKCIVLQWYDSNVVNCLQINKNNVFYLLYVYYLSLREINLRKKIEDLQLQIINKIDSQVLIFLIVFL